MTAKFTPDDSVIEADKGKERIRKALDEHSRRHGEMAGIITSRDPGMNDLFYDLLREDMPGGFTQWQLPIKLEGPALFFLTVVEPGGVVPTHSHKRDLFRVVVSGSIILDDGRELKHTDWMFVPAGVEYSFRGGLNDPGAIIYHCYG